MTNNGQTPGGNTTTAGAVEQLAAELKPCPFCAHPTVGMARMDERNWFAECNRCGASMLPATSEAKAIAAWNTRSQAHSLPGDGMRAIAEEFCLAMEYAAGCDEGVDEDTAASEIMSWAGSPMVVAYTKARAALATEAE